MKAIRHISTVLATFTGLFFCFYIKNLNPLPPINITEQDKALNINTTFLKTISIGNPRLISSILWVKTLLDSDLDHYKNNDLNSWMFLRFNSITDLDPNFYEAYLYGGLYLSIVKDDDLGAKSIYDKGIKIFPNDYELLKNIAFHYHFELKDILGASEFYNRLLSNPQTPNHYRSIYARFASESGDLNEAYQVLYETYAKLSSASSLKEYFRKNLYAIKAEIDLICLNEGKKGCSLLDFNSNPYTKSPQGIFQAQEPWEPFRLKDKMKN